MRGIGCVQCPLSFCVILLKFNPLGIVLSENADFDQNRSEITSIIKDGMVIPIHSTGEDGKPKIDYVINSDDAFYQTKNISSPMFGLMVEAVETLNVLVDDAEYNMSAPRAAVIKKQGKAIVNKVLKLSISAKSSENIKDNKSGGSSLTDKYLKRSSERIIDLKGEMKKAGFMGIFGDKEAEKATD